MHELTIEKLDELNDYKTDVIVTYCGGWEEYEDEYDFINGVKGVVIA